MNDHFIRTKTIHCGQYKEVHIYQYSKTKQAAVRGKRSKRQYLSSPAQKALNEKNSRNYFRYLVHTNFTEEDFRLDLTYKPEHLPKNQQEADKHLSNFLSRIRRIYAKEGVPLKYVAVTTEISTKTGKPNARLHHHLIISGGVTRKCIEAAWKLGRTRADRLQPDESGITALCEYMSGQTDNTQKRRWKQSKNLKKPYATVRDNDISVRKFEKLAQAPPNIAYWQKKFPNHIIDKYNEPEFIYSEQNGWSIKLWMRKENTS